METHSQCKNLYFSKSAQRPSCFRFYSEKMVCIRDLDEVEWVYMERLETSGLAESLSCIYKAFIDDMYMRKILFSFSKSRAIFTPLPMLLRDSLCWTNAPTPPYRRPYSQILSVVKERTQDSCFSSRCTKRCPHPKKPSYSYNAAALTSSIPLSTTSLRIYQSSVSLKIHTRLLRLVASGVD